VACAVGVVAIGCPPAGAQVLHSSAGDVVVETVAKGLDHPWALAFLPAGRVLVTERPGRMRIVAKDGALSPALAGVPKVFASGQGGLLDVALDRGFAQNHTIYFCYAEPVDGRGRTALARARLVDEGTPRLDAVEVIFRQAGPLSSGNHFGCRIVQAPDDNLFLTAGEHFTTRDQAQNLANHLDHSHPARWLGPAGQSLRRQARRQARDLELRPPQSPGSRVPSRDREVVGA
jgi:glucose/arabinose dehydrogenase